MQTGMTRGNRYRDTGYTPTACHLGLAEVWSVVFFGALSASREGSKLALFDPSPQQT